MSNEYPKALCSGTLSVFQQIIVVDKIEEQAKRNEGYVDYADLPETVIANPASNNIKAVDGELNSIKSELLKVLKEKEELQANFEGFRNDVQAMQARIAEIQGDVYLGQSSEIGATSDNLTPELSQNTGDAQSTNGNTDHSDLTIPELKALLKERNVTFKVNAAKPELIALLGG